MIADYLWLFALTGGVLVLGCAIALAILTSRKLTPIEKKMQKDAIDREYHRTNGSKGHGRAP
ncbi:MULTISPECIES: hypothetical protein [unclassified Sinorhizobium]|uniref:hypothetical protein n=1 Tax=unclassified Sinorhizobium TaxID=2613772 RepID=UPI0035248769